nr:hypothetical protein [Tanacetum cinerariifolium]
MIVNSIENGPYVSRMIATPGEPDLPVSIPESFHEQIYEELTENDLKWMDADDQAIQTILLGLLEDIYAAVDSYEIAKEIWERVRQMMKVRQIKNLHEADFTQIYDFLKMNQDKNGGIQGAQNAGVQNGGNQNGLVVVLGIANQSRIGKCVAARAEGTGIGSQARCNNCRGLGHIARNCTARPRRMDATYLQTQLLIAQKEEAGIQLQAEEFDFMAAADGSAEVQLNDNCYDNEIFTQEEQYTDLLEPIPEPQLVLQNDNHVTSVSPSMVQSGGKIEISFPLNEETRAHQETVYRNLVDQVTQSVYQEQCLTRKINALHLSSAKQITTLNDEISNLNKQLSKEKSSISSLIEEKKKLKHDFKTREEKFLDKEVDLEARIKDLENIMLKGIKLFRPCTCSTLSQIHFM